MAASLKVSELTALTSVAAADLFLIADASATASKKVTLTNLEGSISLSNLGSRTISDLSNVASTSLDLSRHFCGIIISTSPLATSSLTKRPDGDEVGSSGSK